MAAVSCWGAGAERTSTEACGPPEQLDNRPGEVVDDLLVLCQDRDATVVGVRPLEAGLFMERGEGRP